MFTIVTQVSLSNFLQLLDMINVLAHLTIRMLECCHVLHGQLFVILGISLTYYPAHIMQLSLIVDKLLEQHFDILPPGMIRILYYMINWLVELRIVYYLTSANSIYINMLMKEIFFCTLSESLVHGRQWISTIILY